MQEMRMDTVFRLFAKAYNEKNYRILFDNVAEQTYKVS